MSEEITVVIVDQDHESRDELAQLLELSGITVATTAGYGVAAATAVQRSRPSCILLSLEGSAARGFQTMNSIAVVAPDVPIVAYSSQLDAASMRRAMLAGAHDYLPAPLDPELVLASLRELLERQTARLRERSPEQSRPDVSGTVITIYGAKGGIGKTTIATNLSTAIAREAGASIALVDMDTLFGDVAIMMGIYDGPTIIGAIRDIGKLNYSNIHDYLFERSDGVFILPALKNPADLDRVRPEHMEKIIGILKQTFDYVVLDTPGTYNENVRLSLEIADVVLLISSLDMASINDTQMALQMLLSWPLAAGKVKLVLNHSSLADDVSDEAVALCLGYDVFWQIPFGREVNRSGQRGEPLVLASPRSKVGENIVELARTIAGMQRRLRVRPKVRKHSRGPLAALVDVFRRRKGRQEEGRAVSSTP